MMTCAKLLVFLCVLRASASDWMSEWMAPIQDQFDGNPENFRRDASNDGSYLKHFEDEYQKMIPFIDTKGNSALSLQDLAGLEGGSVSGLKLKLQTTLENAKTLAESLKTQISEMTKREQLLKELIANGRNGVSTVTVSTIGQMPRKYMIRDGVWCLCTGVMQVPMPVVSPSNTNNQFSPPRCLGQELPTKPDPCVFNSIIKYETIPTRRKMQYVEDDYLCLKPSFNGTLEQYQSVPKRLINETCTNGEIRSLEDHMIECSVRVLSEYDYYPNKSYTALELPFEYCIEQDGSCKLLVAWHVSNATIENFEFLKNELNFKKYFIKRNSAYELYDK